MLFDLEQRDIFNPMHDNIFHKKGLRQCAKLHDFGGAVIVIVVPG